MKHLLFSLSKMLKQSDDGMLRTNKFALKHFCIPKKNFF